MRTGTQSSSLSSEAIRGVDRGPLNSAAVHNDTEYEDVHADEDGLRRLLDDVNENSNNNVRVGNVNELKEMHAINGLGTNDDFLNVIMV